MVSANAVETVSELTINPAVSTAPAPIVLQGVFSSGAFGIPSFGARFDASYGACIFEIGGFCNAGDEAGQ
jgi:hypothetical protein